MRNNYHVIFYWSEEDDCYVGVIPALPGCMADGKTRKELSENADLIIDEWIEAAKKIHHPIPEEDGDSVLKSTNPAVTDVAAYILYRLGSGVTSMQLEKLAFYCQAYCLSWYGKKLGDFEFEDWAHGAVCRELWNTHRHKKYLSKSDYSLTHEFSESEKKFMEQVIAVYGSMSGEELEDINHKDDPWRITRGDIPLYDPDNKVISSELIKDYYSLNP